MDGRTLAGSMALAAVATLGVGMAALYGAGPPPAPDRPKPPPPPETMMNTELRYSASLYRAQLENDAKAFGVKAPADEVWRRPFPYVKEIAARRRLGGKGALETAHLRLTLDVEKHTATVEGQRFGVDHLVLSIENRTGKHLAYRVLTDVTEAKKCLSKGDLPHNAMVLEPHQVVRRTECVYRRDAAVDVTVVEIMELPPLAAYYVARLPPTPAFYDPRTASGHLPLRGTVCPQTFSWRELQDGVDRGQLAWRDLVDFYARHSCEEFSFFAGYRYRTETEAPLPVRPAQ